MAAVWGWGVAALQQISQMRRLMLGNVQLVATSKKLVLSDLSTAAQQCSTLEKTDHIPPLKLSSHHPLRLVPPASCVPPASLPWCWTLDLPRAVPGSHRRILPPCAANPRLHHSPMVVARLLLTFLSSPSRPVSRAGEGSWELLAAARLWWPHLPKHCVTTGCVGRETFDVLILTVCKTAYFPLYSFSETDEQCFCSNNFSTKLNAKQIPTLGNCNLLGGTGKV